VLLPRVADTASITGTKRNGLLIYSNQLGAFAYFDSTSVVWRKLGFTDTTVISTKANTQKVVNDTAAVLRALASTADGVTSVATGYGISGGTITSTGTLTADTSSLSTKLFSEKAVDDTAAVLRAAINAINPSASLSSLTAATATNTINNADYAQEWQWNTLGASGRGLKLTSSSTAGTSAPNYILEISRTGTQSSASAISYGTFSSVSAAASSGTNIGHYGTASGALLNYGVYGFSDYGVYGISSISSGRGTTGASSGNAGSGIYGLHNGSSGTGYAVYGTATGATTTNYGGYFTASGATTNYGTRGAAIDASATTNYGGYFTALSGTNNYAVYVAGLGAFTGGINMKSNNKTADYTATALDYLITCNATSGNITITLPAAAGSDMTGRTYLVKKTDATGNTVTIDANSSETIDGATTYVMSTQWKYVTIMSNGSEWFIIGNN
jgi:hypothetical protein